MSVSNPTNGECLRCLVLRDRELDFLSVLGRMDMDLYYSTGVRRITSGTEGFASALNVLGWLTGLFIDLFDVAGSEPSYARKTERICSEKLQELERGPGLKVPGSHAPPATGAKIEPEAGRPAPALVERSTQTETPISVEIAVGGPLPGRADVGVQAFRVPGGTSKRRRQRRRRRRSDARMSASASPSTNSLKRTAGGGMTAAGPLKVGGRVQRIKRGVRATAPPRPAISGLSFAAVAASAGESRSPPSAVVAGGACGGGMEKVRAPSDGGVSRVSLSSSPPPPRPEPKRKKVGPPPSNAAARKEIGMRTPGSSILAKDRMVGLAPVSPVPKRIWVDGRGARRLWRQE